MGKMELNAISPGKKIGFIARKRGESKEFPYSWNKKNYVLIQLYKKG
jgi:hypothetical protein